MSEGTENAVNLVVFRGYGTPQRLFLSGRVLRNAPDVAVMGASTLRNLAAAFNRLDSNETAQYYRARLLPRRELGDDQRRRGLLRPPDRAGEPGRCHTDVA